MTTQAARHYTNPIDWVFRSRTTGRITIFQAPNLLLWLVLAVFAARTLLHPGGTAGAVLSSVGTVLLLAWAALEVLNGVNPFRRLLGAVVAISQLVTLFATR